MKKICILFHLLFLCLKISAQTEITTKYVDDLNNIAKSNFRYPDTAKLYSLKAYELSKKINYEFGEATALKLIGIYQHSVSDFDKAIDSYQKSLYIFEKLNNDLEIGKLNLNLATTYNAQINYPKVLQYGLKSLQYFKKVKDVNGEARVLNLLGIVSSAQKNYEEALVYFKEYNRLAKSVNDRREIGSSYNNIGSTYNMLNQLDSAIFYFKKSLPIVLENGSSSNIGKLYENIGTLHNTKKRPKQALYFHHKSLTEYVKIEDKKFISHSYYNLGLTYEQLKDTIKARKWLNKAIKQAGEIKDTEILKLSYEKLSKLDVKRNDFEEAYKNLQLSTDMKDSMLNLEKNKFIENLKTKYETEKKEEEIKILNQQSQIKDLEISRKNTFLIFSLILFLIASVLVWMFFNRRKIKNKIELQNEIIRQQDLATKAVLDAEERERRRIASDLHDGVGQMLSASLLNFNGFLTGVKNKLDDDQQLSGERTLSLMTESYDEMRNISHQMMPNSLLKSGLATAVREFVQKIESKKLKITVDIAGMDERLEERIETVLYRVLQESVNNVIKHANASKLSIQLFKDDEGINLTIEDNGVGFDITGAKAGIGLENIKTRIAFINGSIEYDTSPGKGTLVQIFVPNQS